MEHTDPIVRSIRDKLYFLVAQMRTVKKLRFSAEAKPHMYTYRNVNHNLKEDVRQKERVDIYEASLEEY